MRDDREIGSSEEGTPSHAKRRDAWWRKRHFFSISAALLASVAAAITPHSTAAAAAARRGVQSQQQRDGRQQQMRRRRKISRQIQQCSGRTDFCIVIQTDISVYKEERKDVFKEEKMEKCVGNSHRGLRVNDVEKTKTLSSSRGTSS